MTHESLRLAAEFSSTFPILLAAALECSSFFQSQLAYLEFNLYFLLILITLCFVLVTRYIFIVSKIILT